MKNILFSIKQYFAERFSLKEDRAEETTIVEVIRKNIEFKGVNLWALIFAIFIASIGLNVNSTAVIIGAMLISPIMGPIMGIGLGIGINDLQIVEKGVKNLLVATIIGITTSTLYFSITPLHEAQSELLARTSPSIWDVFIAFFGGLAGMVAASRKEKSNVIPGVAIATALMPPLCTAGFGIATGNWLYFLGAIYLYFINSIFIATGTFLITRYLKLKRHHFDDPGYEKKVNRYIIIIVVATVLPSIFLAYRIVQKSIFETNSRIFVEKNFAFSNTQVVSQTFSFGAKKSIDLVLIGREIGKTTLDSLRNRLKDFQLTGVQLHVKQGLTARQNIDLSQIKANILADVFEKQHEADSVNASKRSGAVADTAVLAELQILNRSISSFGLNTMVVHNVGIKAADTMKVALIKVKSPLRNSEKVILQKWLAARYKSPGLNLIVQKK